MESAENQAQPNADQESESISPPLSKTETIALLNDSIDRLEETIKKISEDSAKIPSSDSINSLLSKAQELEKAVTSKSKVKGAKPESKPQQVTPPVQTPKAPSKKAPNSTSVKASAPKASQKKNLGLIVIGVTAIAIIIVTVFWLWKPQVISNLFPKTEPAPTEVAINLAPTPEPFPETFPEKSPGKSPANSSINAPGISDQVDPKIDNNINNNIDTKNPQDLATEIEPSAESTEEEAIAITIPPELIAPGKPKNLKMVTIKPELNFTPEQNLIAALTTKLGELAQDYPSEFIQNVQVNLPDSSLIIQVTDGWYELEESRQNSLGNEILQRSRAFRFDKLELQDKMGTLIARNPIIGENMIMLQNKKQQLSEQLSEDSAPIESYKL
jgi:chemotaxis protein histidine kinase CheA